MTPGLHQPRGWVGGGLMLELPTVQYPLKPPHLGFPPLKQLVSSSAATPQSDEPPPHKFMSASLPAPTVYLRTLVWCVAATSGRADLQLLMVYWGGGAGSASYLVGPILFLSEGVFCSSHAR